MRPTRLSLLFAIWRHLVAENMMNDPFKPGSFYDNFEAGVRALGVNQIPLAFDMAKVKYPSTKERDRMFNILRDMGVSDDE